MSPCAPAGHAEGLRRFSFGLHRLAGGRVNGENWRTHHALYLEVREQAGARRAQRRPPPSPKWSFPS
jgi:hypothetical protein